jgi:PAS domain S-box-containing protein
MAEGHRSHRTFVAGGSTAAAELRGQQVLGRRGAPATSALLAIIVGMPDELHPIDPALFSAVVDLAPDGILLVDPGGRIVFANRVTQTLLGYAPDELIGKPVEFLVPERYRGRHIGYQAEYHAHPAARPMGSGRDLSAMRRDGTELPVEISLSPLPTPAGLHVTAIMRDISVRKGLEEVRRRAEERYRLLAEQARDIIYRIRLVPLPPRVEYMSPAARELTGYGPEDHYADPELLLHQTVPEHRPVLQRFLSDPDSVPETLLIQIRRRDGALVWLEQQFTIVRDSAGRPIAIEGIARDTTARVLMEDERQRLRAASELQADRERIARDLHDGVMQALYGVGLSLMNARYKNADAAPAVATEIDDAVASLNTVIADIRAYVLNLPLARASGEVAGLLTDLIQDLREHSSINVELDIDDDLPPLTDEQKLVVFHMAQEALANVRKHSRAHSVRLCARSEPDAISVQVEDDGVGFDTFVDRGADHMGLRNMRARAEQAGGTLETKSAPGHGTVVRLHLPLTRVRA